MSERKRLSDILLNGERDRLSSVWQAAKPADDLKPIPYGEYRCRLVDGSLFTARSGTVGYKIMVEVLEGEHAGRRLWHDIWITEAAVPIAKRDLQKIGITSLDQLEQPLPEGIIIDARVALRRNDNGEEFNRIVRFVVVGVEQPEPEPFAPSLNGTADESDHLDSDGFNWGCGKQEDPPASGRGRGAYSKP